MTHPPIMLLSSIRSLEHVNRPALILAYGWRTSSGRYHIISKRVAILKTCYRNDLFDIHIPAVCRDTIRLTHSGNRSQAIGFVWRISVTDRRPSDSFERRIPEVAALRIRMRTPSKRLDMFLSER